MVVLRRRPEDALIQQSRDHTNLRRLVNGPADKVRAEAREIIDLGREGGVVIGTHSIDPGSTPLEHYLAYDETCRTYGDFTRVAEDA